MNRTELAELIHNGENSGVEFKRDTEDNRALAKALVAFTNLQGGRVLVGVEKNRTVCGLTRFDLGTGTGDTPRTYDRLEEWIMQACRDKIRPEIIPYFEVIRDVESGLDVAVVEVERGWSVHHVWQDQHRTYYIRVGSLSREASPEELERLFPQRGTFRLELRPISGSSIDDLDPRRLTEYFARVRSQSVPSDEPPAEWRERVEAESKREDESRWREIFDLRLREWREQQRREWVSLLVSTELLDGGDRHPATVAGLLLFGKNPKRYLPQSGVGAAAYDSSDKDYAARERTSLRGPMVALRAADGTTMESGLVEQAVEFVRRNTTVNARPVDGARREDRWEYPEAAVREAVVNALVHRDYSVAGADILLAIYADRLEIQSPGRLPNTVTPAGMKAGMRYARNQTLVNVMRDYRYVDFRGMGVKNKIIPGMLAHNGTEPDLIEDGERFIVRLWKAPGPVGEPSSLPRS